MILGIDTSCYTTSAALVDEQGRLLAEYRRPLSVDLGQCGLRQSEGVFQHIKNLPQVMEGLYSQLPGELPPLLAVSASQRPRPKDGSYMPVFLAGAGLAQSLSAAARVPFYGVSHQEGHIKAALASANQDWQDEKAFLALHLSGGTGEILLVKPEQVGYSMELVGDSDLPPGQFIDRVGVALGLPFPAGPHLEKLAGDVRGPFRLSGSVKGSHISFSGPESAAQRAIAQGVPDQEIAAAVLDNIGKSLAKAVSYMQEQTGCRRVIAAGGVAANGRLRQYLRPLGVHFAEPKFAGDNAYGVALLGLEQWRLSRS